MPWGFLTGIRPTKIVHELMEEKLNEEEIKATNKFLLYKRRQG